MSDLYTVRLTEGERAETLLETVNPAYAVQWLVYHLWQLGKAKAWALIRTGDTGKEVLIEGQRGG